MNYATTFDYFCVNLFWVVNVLLQTAHCLAPLRMFESQLWHVRKLPATWSLAVVFVVSLISSTTHNTKSDDT